MVCFSITDHAVFSGEKNIFLKAELFRSAMQKRLASRVKKVFWCLPTTTTHYQKQTSQFSYDLHNISHTFRLQISMHVKYQHVKSIWRVCENHVSNVWRMLSLSHVTCFFTCNFTYYFTHSFLVPKPFIYRHENFMVNLVTLSGEISESNTTVHNCLK